MKVFLKVALLVLGITGVAAFGYWSYWRNFEKAVFPGEHVEVKRIVSSPDGRLQARIVEGNVDATTSPMVSVEVVSSGSTPPVTIFSMDRWEGAAGTEAVEGRWLNDHSLSVSHREGRIWNKAAAVVVEGRKIQVRYVLRKPIHP